MTLDVARDPFQNLRRYRLKCVKCGDDFGQGYFSGRVQTRRGRWHLFGLQLLGLANNNLQPEPLRPGDQRRQRGERGMSAWAECPGLRICRCIQNLGSMSRKDRPAESVDSRSIESLLKRQS